MRTFRIIFITLASAVVTASAQLPQTLIDEEAAFNEAVKAVRYDYTDIDLLENFLVRFPASRHTAAALLELEKAQILSSGTYDYPYNEPTLLNFTPDERPYQVFFENQKALAEDSITDYSLLREKYEKLLNDNDPAYQNEANYYLGYLDYAERKYNDAKSRFAQLPYESKYVEATQFYLMQMDYAQGNYENVLKTLEQPYYSNLNGEKALEVTRIKAECLARTNQKAEALEQFKKYVNDADKPIAPSAYNCAVLAYNAGDCNTAEKAAIKAALSKDQRLSQYSYMLLGQSYMLAGETPKAKMAFEQAAALDADRDVKEAAEYNKVVITHETRYSPWGDEVVMFENFLNNYPQSKYADNVSTYLTEVYLTTKNYDAALASIRKIKKPSQTILDAKQHLLYQSGIQNYVNGDYVTANKNFTECLDVPASDNTVKPLAYYWRGESRYHLNSLKDAANDYAKALTLNCDSHTLAMANYSLGYVNFKNQAFADAATYFNRMTQTAGEKGTETYYDALTRQGDCAYYNRDFATAENYYATVSASESNSSQYALFQQAFMAGLQKKYSDKQNALDRLIARYPQSDYVDVAWLEKGNTSILQNETNAAINSFKYVVEKYPYSPSAPQAAVQLAMAYNNSGKTAEAQKIYQMVAEKYPNTDEATTALQDLKALATKTLYEEMPKALADGEYQKVIDNFEKLQNENIDFRDLQKMQLMAAKAHQALKNDGLAQQLLETCAKDIRTEAGSEAKYLVAQKFFDQGDTEKALGQVTELIQEGTPHQYWLARAIILMSDISIKNDDAFTAKEYLKSLKANYSDNNEINKMIESRLKKMEQQDVVQDVTEENNDNNNE